MIRHKFDTSILRAYDIRGIADQTLTTDDAFAIGVGFAACVRDHGGKRIVVARDGRLSSPKLAKKLIEGLKAGGMMVTDIGTAPTPMLYFADRMLDTDAAIQVTGSHNPPDHNGFKMVLGHRPFFGEDIIALGDMLKQGVSLSAGGDVEILDMTDAYLDALLAYGGKTSGPGASSIVWDCGNGATGPVVERLVSQLAGRHEVLFAEIDGRFPNHHPDPADAATLSLLRQAVAESSADMGISFDGDGDRIGVIDGKGRQVPGDLLTAYLARGVLRRCPGATILFDVKSSLAALDSVTRNGGEPVLWKTGHSHMKTRLAELGAPLAGEMSGHLFIADGYYGFDDALLAALAVLREEAESDVGITGFMDNLPPVFATPELRIPCDDALKFEIVDRITETIRTAPDPDISGFVDLDGIRVNTPDGWWLIRASNTGAELVARAEGIDAPSQARLEAQIHDRLKNAGLVKMAS